MGDAGQVARVNVASDDVAEAAIAPVNDKVVVAVGDQRQPNLLRPRTANLNLGGVPHGLEDRPGGHLI